MYGYLVRKQEQKSAAEVVKMLFLLNQGLHPGILATIIPL
jgi:hypothetical protein